MNIISEFKKIVNTYPEKTVLVSESEDSLSYRNLDRYSNFIANKIIEQTRNEQEVEVIGVCINRSFNLIAAMLGALKAGMAYLPLDSAFPKERLKLMLDKAEARTIICTEDTANIFDERYNKLLLSDQMHFIEEVHIQNKPSPLACILYTSGSTGTPNGVMITHESILNTLQWAIKFYELTDGDVSLQVPSCSFTSSLQDIYSTLLSGGKLVMINEKRLLNTRYLKMLTDKFKVTHFDMVPSLYKEYLNTVKGESTLRFVLLAGEPLLLKLVSKHFNVLPNVRLINEYGMAETSSCCTVYEVFSDCEKVCIGKFIDNMSYMLHDKDSDGTGELYITGEGLAAGYFNDSSFTDEKFVNIDGTRYLKTGDYVREAADGNIIYIGRKDNQIKVNGKRINLNEIDYALQKDPNTIDCFSAGLLFDGKQIIVTFIKTFQKNTQYFFDLLKKALPNYYIPNFIKIIDEFEYLPNKKINVKGMKDMFKDELEKEVMVNDVIYISIIKVISNISKGLLVKPDINEDIRKQGIDSISFIQLLAALEEDLNFEFGYDDIENMGVVTVKSLYNYVKSLGK